MNASNVEGSRETFYKIKDIYFLSSPAGESLGASSPVKQEQVV